MNILGSVLMAIGLLSTSQLAIAETLSQEEAVSLAESFVAENGYTMAAPKSELNRESLEWTEDRAQMLESRHNTLRPSAIGARPGRRSKKAGWSIAFDFVADGQDLCRVVTMAEDGSEIRVEHVDGIRHYFAGFGDGKPN